jgi:hypothetical protein
MNEVIHLGQESRGQQTLKLKLFIQIPSLLYHNGMD